MRGTDLRTQAKVHILSKIEQGASFGKWTLSKELGKGGNGVNRP